MVSNPNVQSRVKHYDLLLSRELVLLERKHDQNLLTLKKLEQSIRHESKKIPICSRKKVSIRLDEMYNDENQPVTNERKRIHSNDYSNVKSIPNYNNKQNQFNDKPSKFVPKYRRLCTKAHRLPPVAPSHILPLHQRTNNDAHWMASYQPLNKDDDAVSDIISILHEFPKRTASGVSKVEKQVHSFIEALPAYEGAQNGFDNFGPSSLYSTRATVAMR